MKLQDLNPLRCDPRIQFKRETVLGGRDVIIVSYMIADSDLWEQENALEARGITFDAVSGDCIARPFEKFFNVGEREETQPHRLDFEGARVFEKRDGSMITPVLINWCVEFKTKKSFTSDVALSASACAPELLKEFCLHCLSQRITPIFEFTHPQHTVVIEYGDEPKFVLLAARRMDSGEYVELSELMPERWGIECIEEYSLTVDEVFAQMKDRTEFEGYVLLLRDGRRVKIKTEWYLRNHRLRTELRVKDVALAVVDETLDDVKSALALEGFDLSPVEEIERQVVREIAQIETSVKYLADLIRREPTRKDAALKYRQDENFGAAVTLVYGNADSVDYAALWKKRNLKDVSLSVLYRNRKV